MRMNAEKPLCSADELFKGKGKYYLKIPNFDRKVRYLVGAIMRFEDGKYYKKVNLPSNIDTEWGEAPSDEWAAGHWELYHKAVRGDKAEHHAKGHVHVGGWDNSIGWEEKSLCIHNGHVWECVGRFHGLGGDWFAPGNEERKYEHHWGKPPMKSVPVGKGAKKAPLIIDVGCLSDCDENCARNWCGCGK